MNVETHIVLSLFFNLFHSFTDLLWFHLFSDYNEYTCLKTSAVILDHILNPTKSSYQRRQTEKNCPTLLKKTLLNQRKMIRFVGLLGCFLVLEGVRARFESNPLSILNCWYMLFFSRLLYWIPGAAGSSYNFNFKENRYCN